MNRESLLFITLCFVCYSIGLYAYLNKRDNDIAEHHAKVQAKIWEGKFNNAR